MDKTRHIEQLFRMAFLPLSFFALSGCIGEDRDNCPPEMEEAAIVLKVLDTATGEDITTTGEVGQAALFLFTPGGSYAQHISFSGEQIAQRTPVAIRGSSLNGYRVSVWGNAGTGQELHNASANNTVSDQAISLNRGQDGYEGIPDDLFFGDGRLSRPAGAGTPQEIVIVRKNARMYITVRGLDAGTPAGNYYFTIAKPDNGYNYLGEPVRNPALVRETGVFNAAGEFVSRQAFNLIHTDPAQVSEGEVKVNLYKRENTRTGDTLLASVTKDSDGNILTLPTGETINVLIDLNGQTGIEIHMEITPWDEIYQWGSW